MENLYKSSLRLFSGQVLATIISFFASILLIKLIGPTGNGQWALFNTSLSFSVTLLGFSISATIIYFINNQKYAPERVFGFLFQYGLLTSLLLFFVLWIIKFFSNLNFIYPEHLQTLPYILIFCVMYFNSFCSTTYSTIFYAIGKFKAQSIVLLITPILNLLVYSYFNFFNNIAEENVILLPLLSNFIIGFFLQIVIIYIFNNHFTNALSLKSITFLEAKAIFIASFVTHIATVFQFLSYRMDYWFINYYFDKKSLGIYALGTQITQLLWILPSVISQVIYSKLAASTDEKEIIENLERTIRICFIVLSLICIFFMLGVYFLLPIVYGQSFLASIWVIAILIFGIIPFSIPIILASYFLSKGQFKISAYVSAFGFVISTILYTILIPKYGIYGAAISSVCSYLSNCLMCLYIIKKMSPYFSIKRCFQFNFSEILNIFNLATVKQ